MVRFPSSAHRPYSPAVKPAPRFATPAPSHPESSTRNGCRARLLRLYPFGLLGTLGKPAAGTGGTATSVGALLLRPPAATALYLFAHGAGAGMRHPFMEAVSHTLAARRIATLRYEFPYMTAGRRMPDSRGTLVETVRAAARTAAELAPELPLFAGGKSMGAG